MGNLLDRECRGANPLVKALLDMHVLDRRIDFGCQNLQYELEFFMSLFSNTTTRPLRTNPSVRIFNF